MIRKVLIIPVLLSVTMLLTGCDFFRKLAGRPTSAQIEAIAEAIEKEEALKAAEQARQDSLERARQYSADSLEAAMELQKVKFVKSTFKGDSSGDPARNRYTIMVATFSGRANAQKYIASLAEKGYTGIMVPFRNSQVGVGICGTDDLVTLNREFQNLKRQSFCPKGVWILETE